MGSGNDPKLTGGRGITPVAGVKPPQASLPAPVPAKKTYFPVLKKLNGTELYERALLINRKLEQWGINNIKIRKSTVAVLQGLKDGKTIRVIATMDMQIYKTMKLHEKELLEIGEVLATEPVIATHLVPGKLKDEIVGGHAVVHAEQHAAEFARQLGVVNGEVATSVLGCEMCEQYLKEQHPGIKHVNTKTAAEEAKKKQRGTAGNTPRRGKRDKKPPADDAGSTKPAKPSKKRRPPRGDKKPKPKPGAGNPAAAGKAAAGAADNAPVPKNTATTADAVDNAPATRTAGAAAANGVDDAAGRRLAGATDDAVSHMHAPKPDVPDVKPPTIKPGAVAKDAVSKTPLKIRFKVKISPRLRAGGLFIVELALEIGLSYFENKRVQGLIMKAINKNLDAYKVLLEREDEQREIARFRAGKEGEKGYQLYFRTKLLFTRHCSDGGCGTNGSIQDVVFMKTELRRHSDDNSVPDPKSDSGWTDEFNGHYGQTGYVYSPVFAKGEPIREGTEDAADERFNTFINLFIKREGKRLHDIHKTYYKQFERYAVLITHSKANLLMAYLEDELAMAILSVEFWDQEPETLLRPPFNMKFGEILERVRWGIAYRWGFIDRYYRTVLRMNKQDQVYYLELYDKYFQELDDESGNCNRPCNRMTGNKGLRNRRTADDARKMQEPTDMMKGFTNMPDEKLQVLDAWIKAQ